MKLRLKREKKNTVEIENIEDSEILEVQEGSMYAAAESVETVEVVGERAVNELPVNEIAVSGSNEMFQIEEVMPTGLIYDDSMVRVADISDEFLAIMEPILRMYNAAMSVATARIDIIRDEFKYKKARCPVHHIDTRLKSAGSILGKLQKKQLDLTISAACNNIYDIAGVRIVCPYIKDVYLIRDRILAQDDIEIMKTKDYIKHPKENGYRSYHMVIRVPVFFMNKKQMVPVEIQIRTQAMDLWASLEHDIRYKAINSKGEYNGDYSEFEDELTECSRLIYEAEEKMERMNSMLE